MGEEGVPVIPVVGVSLDKFAALASELLDDIFGYL